MGTITRSHRLLGQGVVGLITLGSVLLVACGTAAPPAPSEVTTAPPEPLSQATTPTPDPTAQPSQTQNVKDTFILVTSAEPGSLDAWDTTAMLP
jgi:hypothetical protein